MQRLRRAVHQGSSVFDILLQSRRSRKAAAQVCENNARTNAIGLTSALMCLILFAYRVVPGAPLIVAANRDEHFNRPAAPAAIWDDHPGILAGRDLSGGGTWLGVSTSGRFAALTNFRNPATHRADAPSRGKLVEAFLVGQILERERRHSALRILNPDYGTRCSTVLRITSEGTIDFAERSFHPEGGIAGDVKYQLKMMSPGLR